MEKIKIKTETIKLDQFLKWAEITNSGGEAKALITEGLVKLNGEVETRRGKVLNSGDVIEFQGKKYQVNRE